MTEAREGQWQGLYQQSDSWRTRITDNREYLKYILLQANPLLPPLQFPREQQYPRPYGMAPTREQVRRYRDTLREHLQARADMGDLLSEALIPWLQPDPLEQVRDVLDNFVASHDPHEFPIPPAPEGRWEIPPYSYSGTPEWREP